MRVTIEQKTEMQEKFRKPSKLRFIYNAISPPEKLPAYFVHVTVELSDKERSVLAKHSLWETVLFQSPFRWDQDFLQTISREFGYEKAQEMTKPSDVTIKQFLKDSTYSIYFQTPLEAKDFDTQLREEILPKLKKYIEASELAAKPSKDTFEL